jgi:hypothetical protein
MCIAAILELPVSLIPDWDDEQGKWLDKYRDWLQQFNLTIIWYEYQHAKYPRGYAILEVKSKIHPNGEHAVVCHDGHIVWDSLYETWAEEEKLRWYVFTVLDASLLLKRLS